MKFGFLVALIGIFALAPSAFALDAEASGLFRQLVSLEETDLAGIWASPEDPSLVFNIEETGKMVFFSMFAAPEETAPDACAVVEVNNISKIRYDYNLYAYNSVTIESVNMLREFVKGDRKLCYGGAIIDEFSMVNASHTFKVISDDVLLLMRDDGVTVRFERQPL